MTQRNLFDAEAPAHLGGVRLGWSVEFVEPAHFHRLANPVEHEPSRFLSDAQSPPEFVAADPVLAIRDCPDRDKPLIEAEGRSATRERVLARLQEGPATNVQLLDICMRFGARILELRREGYDIRTKPRGGGIFLYVLHAAPAAGREP